MPGAAQSRGAQSAAMEDEMTDRSKTGTPDRRLADIVREVKIAAADRSDVVVDMRDADRARLEILADELASVVAQIDPADDRFDLGISSGQQPRLWIDAVAHVHMGKDRRIFRFVRDTRLGRVVLAESGEVKQVADAVSRYVAERIIERERVLSGDFLPIERRNRMADEDKTEAGQAGDAGGTTVRASGEDKWALPLEASGPAAADKAPGHAQPAEAPAVRPHGRGAGFVIGTSWFILGCVAGAAALIAALWDRISAFVN